MRTLLATLTSALLFGVTSAQAAPITTLFSTGVDGTGAALPGGTVDPHWTVNGGTAYTLTGNPLDNGWIGDLPNAQWISANSAGEPAPGDYTYATTFDLTAFLLSSVSISATISADDGAVVKLNGNVVFDASYPGNPSPWNDYESFFVTTGFVQGLNTLSAFVPNSDGPGGALFQIVGSGGDPAVPEPGTLSMLVAGGVVGMVGLIRRRKRSKP